MTDDRLLVPMHLSAMVLNSDAALLTPFARFQPQYGKLARLEPVGPEPFDYPSEQPLPGIHLHWLLPRELRHAADARKGGAGFPLAPNRWAVVRVRTAGAAGPAVKAWVVISDQVSKQGASPFVDSTSETPEEIQIGCSVVLDAALTELPETGTPFLLAVAPGSATFALFAPAAQNVFAFHDPVEETGEDLTFTYHVTGWYSKPEHDPLSEVKWQAQTGPGLQGAWVDDTFGFTAWTGTAEPPKQMLVHAFAYEVAWKPSEKNHALPSYPENVSEQVTVAAGNTAIDGLSQVVSHRRKNPEEGRLLQAFQYGLLDHFDQPASAAALDRAIRSHWFGAKPGGTLWTVVAQQTGLDGALPSPPPPVLSDEQAAKLDALNVLQRELDTQSRILASMRWTLSALWWKHAWLKADLTREPPRLEAAWVISQLEVQLGLHAPEAGGATPYLTQVQERAEKVSRLSGEVKAACQALDAALDAAAQQRKAANLPQYFAPTDPTVLVTGLGRSTVLDPGGEMTCRVPSQTVQTLEPVTPSVPPLADPHSLLPPGVQALHVEAVLLSPAPQAPAPPAPGKRFPPSPVAMSEWAPPWVPLLLDWQVTVLNAPAYSKQKKPPAWNFDPANWEFDGTDYNWVGTKAAADFSEGGSRQMQLQGRTFLTPHLPNTLAAQIHAYVTEHGAGDPALKELLEDLDAEMQTVSQQDVLSQNLSGLRRLLVQRDPTPTPSPPAGPIADALGPEPQRGFPRPFPDEVRLPVWDFAPVAGSFFSIDRLTVIDHQGQAVDITYANHNPQPSTPGRDPALGFYPLAAPGVRTPMSADPPPTQPLGGENVSQRMLQLPPRLAQDAQVRFGLRSADGFDTDVTLRSRATPVCGWLLPNHLDRSLAVYDSEGEALGELSMSSRPGTGYVPRWTRDPTNHAAPGSVGEIHNSYLASMLEAICARRDEGAGFSDLLLTIDEALWTIEAGEPRSGRDLNILVGRPLALVRAELSLCLHGLPYANQDWWSTFDVPDPGNLPQPPTRAVPLKADDGGLGALTWPVRLGDEELRDDGLIGYFADNPTAAGETWKTFVAVNRPPAAASGYVSEAGSAATPYPRLRFVDDTVAAPDPAQQQAVKLTLLVDPRAAVHAFTGLLPVTALEVPSAYTSAAFRTMSYLFRAGPILTPPDEIKLSSPSRRIGEWSWFDHGLGGTAPLVPADDKATLPNTAARAVEGWLKLTPNPDVKEDVR